jgi:transcriptional regulator with XRE-family HTH domain
MLPMTATFGDVIREAREHRKWLGRELAARVDVDPATLSRIEHNKYKETPAPDLVRRFSTVLNIPEWELVAVLGYRVGDPFTGATLPVFDETRSALLNKLEVVRLDDETRVSTLLTILDLWLRQDRDAEHPVEQFMGGGSNNGARSGNGDVAPDQP